MTVNVFAAQATTGATRHTLFLTASSPPFALARFDHP